jgi:hypothetical protein
MQAEIDMMGEKLISWRYMVENAMDSANPACRDWLRSAIENVDVQLMFLENARNIA